MSTITIQIPESVKKNAIRLAEADGISADQFYALAAAEKLAALEAESYIARRAARSDDVAYEAMMKKIPGTNPVEDWDQIPD